MGPLDRRRPRAFLAVVLMVVSVVGSAGAAHGQPDARPLDLAALALLLVSPLALVLLVPRPVLAVAVSVGAAGVFLVAGYPWGPVLAGPVGVLVGVQLSGPADRARRVAWAGAVLLAGAVVAAAALRPDAPPRATLLGGTAWTVVVLLVSGAVRDRSTRVAEARAAERASRAERERTAVASERLRIAREVHDVLAHSLSAITVQSGVGLHLLDRDPEQARRALTAIRATSTEALDEVRAVLGVVRGDATPGGAGPGQDGAREGADDGASVAPDDVPLAPTWDLSALPRLVRQAEAGGLVVTLDVDPAAAALPDRLAGVVYRVVQESLTNVRRHAHGATRADVRVTVRREGREGREPGEPDAGALSGTVTVTVTDDGATAPPHPEPGYRLRGMQERVESVGGALDAGAAPLGATASPGRGFRVRAVFPWPGTTSAPSTTGGSPATTRRSEEAP